MRAHVTRALLFNLGSMLGSLILAIHSLRSREPKRKVTGLPGFRAQKLNSATKVSDDFVRQLLDKCGKAAPPCLLW